MRPPWPTRVFAALALGLALPLATAAACRPAEPAESHAIPGVGAHPDAVLDAVQPTPSAGARVERWRVRVAGGYEPARVKAEHAQVLAWYRGALEDAGYALRSDAGESLQLYTNAAGCTAYVSLIVDATAPETLLLELGSASADGVCGTATAPSE